MPGGEGRRSFHEARCALEAMTLGGSAERSGRRRRVATYKDLGSFQLLLSLQDDEALRLFCDSILGPIEASEGGYGGELMRSLEAFIEENGQWERAARRLYCHRHTLRYRIKRVEELTAGIFTTPVTGSSSGSHCGAASWWLMKVGVPNRGQSDEYRVALTPQGCGSSSTRAMRCTYRAARARARRSPTTPTRRRARAIVPDADEVFADAELIVKVKEPQPRRSSCSSPRHILFTYLHLAADAELTAP